MHGECIAVCPGLQRTELENTGLIMNLRLGRACQLRLSAGDGQVSVVRVETLCPKPSTLQLYPTLLRSWGLTSPHQNVRW